MSDVIQAKHKRFVGLHCIEEGIAVAVAQWKGADIDVIQTCILETVKDPHIQAQTLARFVTEQQLQGVNCCIVLNSDAYSLTMIDAPNVPPEELSAAARWSLKETFTASLDKATIEAFSIPLARARDNVKLAYAVVCQNTEIDKIKSLVETAGLVLDAVDIPELVLRDLLCLHPNSQAGFVGLWLQVVGGQLIVCYESMLYIARKLETNHNFLLNTQIESNADNLLACDTLLESLAIEIYRSEDYVYTTFKTSEQPATVIIAPTVLRATEIQRSLKEYLSQEVYVLDCMDVLPFKEKVSLDLQARTCMAIGASIRYGKTV